MLYLRLQNIQYSVVPYTILCCLLHNPQYTVVLYKVLCCPLHSTMLSFTQYYIACNITFVQTGLQTEICLACDEVCCRRVHLLFFLGKPVERI